MTALAPFVRILGRGPGRARSLTQDEAREAMGLILGGEAAPEAVGALLMLMRYRGESADEIAGFTQAVRAQAAKGAVPASRTTAALGGTPAVDWPSYAAGRTRGLPLFLLSARLLAQAGRPVLLHGWNAHQSTGADVRRALPYVGIAQANNLADAQTHLIEDGIAYLPVEAACPHLLDLLRLRETLGLRSCLNTVARMLNPGRAPLCVQGVFHPSYRALQRDAAMRLDQPETLTLKGAGGEFERHPGKPVEVVAQRGATAYTAHAPALLTGATRLADGPDLPRDPAALGALWRGEVTDVFAEACITGTTALVLVALGDATTDTDALEQARALWRDRARRSTPFEALPAPVTAAPSPTPPPATPERTPL